MAKRHSTSRSRIFEITIEKVETVTVNHRREVVIVRSGEAKELESKADTLPVSDQTKLVTDVSTPLDDTTEKDTTRKN